MAGYRDFQGCVRKNQDKEDPEAYCAEIMRRTEGATGKVFVPARFEVKGDEIIGYANAPVVDRGDSKARDLIPADTWLKALVEFFATGAEINFMHRPQFIVGRTKSVRVSEEGPLLITVPTKAWVKDAIEAGDIKGYSIEYKLYEFKLQPPKGADPRPVRQFKRFSLVRVSYVDEPMNPGSYFITGGKQVKLKDYQIEFDRDNKRITIGAADDAAMSAISDYLADGIKGEKLDLKALPDLAAAVGVKAEDFEDGIDYSVKLVEGDKLKGLFENFKDELVAALKPRKAEKPEELKEAIEELVEGLKGLGLDAGKLEALENGLNEVKAGLPADESLSDILEGLKNDDKVKSLADRVEENAKNIEVIARAVNDLTGRKTSMTPGGDGAKSSDDAWGPDGNPDGFSS